MTIIFLKDEEGNEEDYEAESGEEAEVTNEPSLRDAVVQDNTGFLFFPFLCFPFLSFLFLFSFPFSSACFSCFYLHFVLETFLSFIPVFLFSDYFSGQTPATPPAISTSTTEPESQPTESGEQ